jgi:hypothetical protein
MAMDTNRPPNDSSTSVRSRRSSDSRPRTEKIAAMLEMTYAVMNRKLPEPAALAMMATDLAEELSDDQLAIGLKRLRKERDFVSVKDIILLSGGGNVQDVSEAHKAWDVLMDFVGKYVNSDAEGNYRPDQGVRTTPMPKLSQRITDVVRLTGGWRIYRCMTIESTPHVQKRFFDEYALWTNLQAIDNSKLLEPGEALKQLTAGTSSNPLSNEGAKPEVTRRVRKIPPVPTPAELRDRAAAQKAQLDQWATRRKAAK